MSTARRDARISMALAVVATVVGLVLLGLAFYSSLPGSCGRPTGCPGGRDATPLTGIAVASIMLGAAWAAWRKSRRLREAAPERGETAASQE